MANNWQNKGQGGGISWGTKDSGGGKGQGQRSKDKKKSSFNLSQSVSRQVEKGNRASAQPVPSQGETPKSSGLSNELAVSEQLASKFWRPKELEKGAAGPKILCLHGYTQSGPTFKRKLAGLEKYLAEQLPGVTFTYPTGPHDASAEWVEQLDAEDLAALKGTAAAQSRSWWLKEGEGGAVEGWEKSWRLLGETNSRSGPFDAVLGFSQGAAAAALVAVALQIPRVVAVGGYVPTGHPLSPALEAGGHRLASLHAAGAADKLVAVTASHQLAACFQVRYQHSYNNHRMF
jgi:hypothetical protein